MRDEFMRALKGIDEEELEDDFYDEVIDEEDFTDDSKKSLKNNTKNSLKNNTKNNTKYSSKNDPEDDFKEDYNEDFEEDTEDDFEDSFLDDFEDGLPEDGLLIRGHRRKKAAGITGKEKLSSKKKAGKKGLFLMDEGDESDLSDSGMFDEEDSGFSDAGRNARTEDLPEEYDDEEDLRRADPPIRRSAARNPRSSRDEIADGIQHVERQIAKQAPPRRAYKFPPIKLLNRSKGSQGGDSEEYLRKTAQKLQDTLYNFGVNAKVTNVCCGPTVTRFELQPEMGVKVSRIVGLANDIQLNLAVSDIRIEAPIPGKAAVGIEVPNVEKTPVLLRDLLESSEFERSSSMLSFAVGKDIAGKAIVSDIAKMPHLLVAGTTGSGKSVCINTLIISILYKASPDDVKFIMIDPKVVELSVYNGIPHLLIPVVTDPKKAAGALNWAVAEMDRRYNVFAEYNVRKIEEYNDKIERMTFSEEEEKPSRMPQMIVIVDELADLMMVAPKDVEDAIIRLAQKARACGIHLIIATQRPSVNVITGTIKANMPSRIAFSVASGVDSRTILDMNGAEKLLGKGDMLFHPLGLSKPVRLQGSFVSDDEVSSVVEYIKEKNPIPEYDSKIEKQLVSTMPGAAISGQDDEQDVYFVEAGRFVVEKEKATMGMLQKTFKIGFNRAARIMDQLADAGVVGPEEGTKPRKVLMSMEEFENYLEEHG